MTTIKLCDATDSSWLDMRAKGVGASEVAAAVGLSEWQTPREVYHRKRGELPALEENDAMRLGKLLEPVIASEFTRETNIEVIESPMGLYGREDEPWALATPDADLISGALGEWKSTNFRRAAELGANETDEIPSEWVCQAAWQMHVMGRDCVEFGVLIDGRTFRRFTVHRNERLILGLRDRIAGFWRQVQDGVPPDFDAAHRSTRDLLTLIYKDVELHKRVELSLDAAASWRAEQEIRERIKALEDEAEAHKNRYISELGDSNFGIIPGHEKMVKRAIQNRKEYTVKANSFVAIRTVKFDGILPGEKL